jgi:ubiquitin C-terminal hydrolase
VLFDLYAVLVHSDNGDHFTFICIGGQFYHFNDSIVSFATGDQAIGQNFGGNLATAAYMLFYVGQAF